MKRLFSIILAVACLIAAALLLPRFIANKPKGASEASASPKTDVTETWNRPRLPKAALPDAPGEDQIREIQGWLSAAPGAFMPPASDREAWASVKVDRNEIIKRAEGALKQPIPELPDELYLEFMKTGKRDSFEKPYNVRRERM